MVYHLFNYTRTITTFFICGYRLNNFYSIEFDQVMKIPLLYGVIFIVKSHFKKFWQLCSLSWNCSQIFTTFLWMNIIDVKVVKLIQKILKIYTQLNSKEIYMLCSFYEITNIQWYKIKIIGHVMVISYKLIP